ncbi:MAG: hypothetical protein K6F71_03585 [Ruminococcus sp.]|uniref:hypothetical protein n=1 Tax=Ruminococcus sp. TaxID=41978 RepID=UPI0025E4371F|nr:hypothetical protein [Ruminococcus sp.]MCR5539905.1 hypothetical protein [Ruminococcus sp.]
MNKILKQLKNNWIRIWLLVIMVSCSVFVVYAAYTDVFSVKRVVSTTNSPEMPFSSNCMKAELSSYQLPSSVFSVTVCNYDQNYPNDYCSSRITYSFEAELMVKKDDGTYENAGSFLTRLATARDNYEITQETYDSYVSKVAKYSISKTEDDDTGIISSAIDNKFTSDNGYKHSFGADTLATGKSSTDTYTVKIDPDDLTQTNTQFFVFVKATPTEGVQTELKARLFAAEGKDIEASWSGSIQEVLVTIDGGITIPVDYDFYNYIVTGSGTGSIDILWDPSHVEVNKFFLTEENKTADIILSTDTTQTGDKTTTYGARYANWKRITIPVNSTNRNRYELQIYKTNENQTLVSPSSYISCEFKKTQ